MELSDTTNPSKHIAIDIDGVLRNFMDEVYNRFREEYPHLRDELIHHSRIEAFHIKHIAPDSKDVQRKIVEYAFSDPHTSYEVFRFADPYLDALSEYRRFYIQAQKHGHTVSLCSSQRTMHQKTATMDWIEAHDVPNDNVILTSAEKGIYGFDVCIDDHVDNCLSVLENGGEAYLMMHPFNLQRRDEVFNHPNGFEVPNFETFSQRFFSNAESLEAA